MSGAKARPVRPGSDFERAWSPRKRKDFLDHLSFSANVRASARAVAMSEQSAYKLRARCDLFRAGWEAALREGYTRLELMMLERAIGGTVKRAAKSGQPAGEMVEYSDKLGLALLAAHRATVRGTAEAPADPGAARRRIEAKLEEMNQRLGSVD